MLGPVRLTVTPARHTNPLRCSRPCVVPQHTPDALSWGSVRYRSETFPVLVLGLEDQLYSAAAVSCDVTPTGRSSSLLVHGCGCCAAQSWCWCLGMDLRITTCVCILIRHLTSVPSCLSEMLRGLLEPASRIGLSQESLGTGSGVNIVYTANTQAAEVLVLG